MQIKVCGIKEERELRYLEENRVEYAGFVLYEKSKRYISIEKVKRLCRPSNSSIKKVGVAVEPDLKLAAEIAQSGIDILQIHGKVSEELLAHTSIPLWIAVPISGIAELGRVMWDMDEWGEHIDGIVVDANRPGGGRTFDWSSHSGRSEQIVNTFRKQLARQNIRFILAGGLSSENVVEGIRIFSPDIVDVSSGVENSTKISFTGKDPDKIRQFTECVRNGNR